MKLLVTVGLDSPVAEALSSRLDARVLSYPGIPHGYSIDGKVLIESPRVVGRMLEPFAVVFYSYFNSPEADAFRRALALSDVPTFPDVRRTLPLDDKVIGLVMALGSNIPSLPRGYVNKGLTPFNGERVFKWGNAHCGEGKVKTTAGFLLESPAIVEPFIEGISERILVVGQEAWHLRYESEDWRKNVRSTVTVLDQPNAVLLDLALRTTEHLQLTVAGVDFITKDGVSFLLEVNAYPSLDEVPDAQKAFVDNVESWWSRWKGPS